MHGKQRCDYLTYDDAVFSPTLSADTQRSMVYFSFHLFFCWLLIFINNERTSASLSTTTYTQIHADRAIDFFILCSLTLIDGLWAECINAYSVVQWTSKLENVIEVVINNLRLRFGPRRKKKLEKRVGSRSDCCILQYWAFVAECAVQAPCNGNSNHCFTINCPHQSIGDEHYFFANLGISATNDGFLSKQSLFMVHWIHRRRQNEAATTFTYNWSHAHIIHFPFSICRLPTETKTYRRSTWFMESWTGVNDFYFVDIN